MRYKLARVILTDPRPSASVKRAGSVNHSHASTDWSKL
jgi:hypothetical protein